MYPRLTSLHLGCSLLWPDPLKLGNLENLRAFRVSNEGCGDCPHRGSGGAVVPHSLCELPNLAFIEARTECVTEIPLCLSRLTSPESLNFAHEDAYGSPLLAVPSPSNLPQIQKWQRVLLNFTTRRLGWLLNALAPIHCALPTQPQGI